MTDHSLVLDGGRLEMLRIDDVSLRVRVMGRGDNRVPLRSLVRVHCHGEPATGFSTLLELAGRHIPVTFFDRRGQVKAQLYHPHPQSRPLSLWLEQCLAEQPFLASFDIWLENQQAGLFTQLDIHQGGLVDRHATLMTELSLFLGAHPELRDDFELMQEQLRQHLLAHLGEAMLVHGMPAGSSMRERLFGEFRDMLDFWLDGQAWRWLQRLPAPSASREWSQRFYSFISAELSRRVAVLLKQFQGFVEAYALEQTPLHTLN